MKTFMRVLLAIATFSVVLSLALANAYAEPVGGNVSIVTQPQRVTIQNISSAINATAGNVTQVDVNGNRVTKYWQGFYGNVSGNIILGTPDGSNLYNWGQGTMSGTVFASRNSSRINWTGVNCPTVGQVENLDTYLDADPKRTRDSANQTFNWTSHPSFKIAGRDISGCRSTPVNGTPDSPDGFWNVLLNDNGTDISSGGDDITIFGAIIDADKLGFNGNTYDFQMLVGEPGNGSEEYPAGTPTTYFFYVQLS